MHCFIITAQRGWVSVSGFCLPAVSQAQRNCGVPGGWLLRERQAPRCVLLPSNGWGGHALVHRGGFEVSALPSLPAARSPQLQARLRTTTWNPNPAARPIRPSQLGRLDPNQLGRQFHPPAATHQPTLCSLTSSSPHSPPPLGSCSVTLCNVRRPTSAHQPLRPPPDRGPVHLHHVVETHQECALPPFGSPFLCPSRSVFPPSSDRDGAIRPPGPGCVSTTSLTASSP